ncbi:putative ABC transporter [Trypanosoma rangeli]|uniref:Putative ABC transporter n=1 Tax=Trypanosoma rangeli TaxID=5698 RepID=A0A3R7KD05_TRYRA|nr:putative ABC transporter [Trypanosoma rangeli]RNF04046.1 putative ABC transporter [Trypanosoma rangeli]|eukprot:RNF04046.1 putative ABC transporter [Trypanosoma rangeli]
MFGGSGNGLDETTPLVTSEARAHWRGLTHPVFSKTAGDVGQLCDAARRHLRSVFRVGGLNICIIEVSVVTDSQLSRCLPRFFPPKRYCDAALALMRGGGFHVIADVDGVAGSGLLRVITGTALCASGTVLANGVPVEAGVFRKAVGIFTNVEAYMPNLTVEENINFVVSMRTNVTGEAREGLVEAACVLTELDRHKVAKLLSPSEAFRLRLAMEIVRDPPVIVAYYPFDCMEHADASECSAVLKRLTTVLEKTVIVSTTTLSSYLFEVTDALLLLGRGGCVLYSGDAATMPLYFNGLYASLNSSSAPYVNVSQGASPGYSNTSTPYRVTDFTSSAREGSYNGSDARHILSSLSLRIQESRAAARNTFVSCGDDALDLATLWAESQTVTEFYAAKFYNSHLRRRVFQTIMRFSNPPQHVSDVAPFTSTVPSQYAVLKPFLLWWYDAMQTWRDSEVYAHLALLSLGLLVIALLMQNQNDDQGGMYNIRGMQFVLFLLTMLANTTTMGDVDHQLRLFFLQRDNGLYGTACFMIVFLLRTVFVRVVYLAFFIPVVIYVLKMSYTFFLLVGALSVTQVLLHVTVHALVPRNRLALIVLRLYLGYNAIFCGFLLNLTTMPSMVGKMSILRWSYGAALAQSLRDMPFSCDGSGNTSYCYSGNTYLALEGFSDESTERSLVVFSVMCGMLIILMGIALACRK